MLPLLPFVAGIAAGAAASELWRRGAVQKGFNTASDKIRSAASSSMESVRQTGAQLRETVSDRLQKAWPGRDEPEIVLRKPSGNGPARQAARSARAHARATSTAASRVAARQRRAVRHQAASAGRSPAAGKPAPAIKRTRKTKA
ncbi:MAG: hypothetical protein Q4B17_02170 [Lautropia sp.]|nr:hypothetical protein [Lautropia sp.]